MTKGDVVDGKICVFYDGKQLLRVPCKYLKYLVQCYILRFKCVVTRSITAKYTALKDSIVI